MNIGMPFDILSIIYIESIHRHTRVINDVIRSIFSAVSREKIRHSEHLSILPPSRETRGIKLKIDRQRDRMEKGNRKF